MLSISSNTSAMIQTSLEKTASVVQRSMQRLSSGLRINGAADDAAGLAISISLAAKLMSANQATRNAVDGMSLTQTAEQALKETSSNLVRMRELAVQAANGTLSSSDRQDLQAENDQLVSQITQVANSTRFNGKALLSGGGATFLQLGGAPGDGISFSLPSTAAENLGPKGIVDVDGALVDSSSLNNAAFTDPATALVINGQQIATQDDGVSGNFGLGSALAVANAVNSSGIANLSASAGATVANLGSVQLLSGGVSGFRAVDLTINGSAIGSAFWDPATGQSFGQALANRINGDGTFGGINAAYANGQFTLTANDGRSFEVATSGKVLNKTSFSGLATNDGVAKNKTAIGSLELTTTKPMNISHGFSIASGQGRNLGTGVYPFSLASTNTLMSQQTAQDYLRVIDISVGQIDSIRSQLGALQSAIGFSAAANQNAADNLAASRSRIVDADLATETATLVRGQILQQAGVAILSQANQSPNSVLMLFP